VIIISNFQNLIEFHKKTYFNHPYGKEGFEALNFIVNLIEKNKIKIVTPHPLINHFMVAYEMNYLWLIQHAKKLILLTKISGSEKLYKQFGHQNEYTKSLYEIETALKALTNNLDVKFIPTTNTRTPDLLIKNEQKEFYIEITSINPQKEFQIVNDFYFDLLNFSFINKMKIGGTIVSFNLPKKRIEEITNEIKRKIIESKNSLKYIEYNLPGIMTFHIAPRDYISNEKKFYQFEFVHKDEKTLINRIYEKILNKLDQIVIDDHLSALIIYVSIEDSTLDDLFRNHLHRINGILKTLPSVLGTAIASLRTYSDYPKETQVERNDNAILISLSPNIQENEKILLWKNPINDDSKEIESMFTKYQENLKNIVKTIDINK